MEATKSIRPGGGITILSSSADDEFADVQQRIRALVDRFPALDGQLMSASDLVGLANERRIAIGEDAPRC